MRFILFAFAFMTLACSDDSKPCTATGTCEYGSPCASDDECASKLCRELDDLERQCTTECSGATDCPAGLVCGVDPERRDVSSCQLPCNLAIWDADERVACRDGVRTRCEELEPGEECWDCGCADGEYCPNSDDPSGEDSRCRPKRDRGETCYDGRYCLSGNCSAVVDYMASEEPGTCIAAQGAPCENECTLCLDLTSDGPVCVAQCSPVYDACPDGTQCTNFGGDVAGRCMPTCQIAPSDSCLSDSLYCYTEENRQTGVCWPRQRF